MKKLINYVCILFFCSAFSQNNISVSQALNIASKQSMLCERLAKEKIFKATNPNNLNTEQKLGVSLIQFEKNISLLKAIKLPENILNKIVTTEMLWIGYRKTILDKDKTSTVKIVEYSNVVLHHSNDLFNHLLELSEENKSYPYNTSIKELPKAYKAANHLKYLSQKVSLYYNAYYSKVIPYDPLKLNQIITEIDNSITTILKSKRISDNVNTKINNVKVDWNHLKMDIERAINDNFTNIVKYHKPEYILTETSKLLKDADLLIRLYRESGEIE